MNEPLEHQETSTANVPTLINPSSSESYDFDTNPEEEDFLIAAGLKMEPRRTIESTTSVNDQINHQKLIVQNVENDIAFNRKKINSLHKKIKILDKKSESLFLHPDNDSPIKNKSPIKLGMITHISLPRLKN